MDNNISIIIKDLELEKSRIDDELSKFIKETLVNLTNACSEKFDKSIPNMNFVKTINYEITTAKDKVARLLLAYNKNKTNELKLSLRNAEMKRDDLIETAISFYDEKNKYLKKIITTTIKKNI